MIEMQAIERIWRIGMKTNLNENDELNEPSHRGNILMEFAINIAIDTIFKKPQSSTMITGFSNFH